MFDRKLGKRLRDEVPVLQPDRPEYDECVTDAQKAMERLLIETNRDAPKKHPSFPPFKKKKKKKTFFKEYKMHADDDLYESKTENKEEKYESANANEHEDDNNGNNNSNNFQLKGKGLKEANDVDVKGEAFKAENEDDSDWEYSFASRGQGQSKKLAHKPNSLHSSLSNSSHRAKRPKKNAHHSSHDPKHNSNTWNDENGIHHGTHNNNNNNSIDNDSGISDGIHLSSQMPPNKRRKLESKKNKRHMALAKIRTTWRLSTLDMIKVPKLAKADRNSSSSFHNSPTVSDHGDDYRSDLINTNNSNNNNNNNN
ncbi:hypothetical protein RFI_16763, partial [Reticulomyxa filosa]